MKYWIHEATQKWGTLDSANGLTDVFGTDHLRRLDANGIVVVDREGFLARVNRLKEQAIRIEYSAFAPCSNLFEGFPVGTSDFQMAV